MHPSVTRFSFYSSDSLPKIRTLIKYIASLHSHDLISTTHIQKMNWKSSLVFFAIVAVCYSHPLHTFPPHCAHIVIREHTQLHHTLPQQRQQGLPPPLPPQHNLPPTTAPHASGSPLPSLFSHIFLVTTTASLDKLTKRYWFSCTSMNSSLRFSPPTLSSRLHPLHHHTLTPLFSFLIISLVHSEDHLGPTRTTGSLETTASGMVWSVIRTERLSQCMFPPSSTLCLPLLHLLSLSLSVPLLFVNLIIIEISQATT